MWVYRYVNKRQEGGVVLWDGRRQGGKGVLEEILSIEDPSKNGEEDFSELEEISI